MDFILFQSFGKFYNFSRFLEFQNEYEPNKYCAVLKKILHRLKAMTLSDILARLVALRNVLVWSDSCSPRIFEIFVGKITTMLKYIEKQCNFAK